MGNRKLVFGNRLAGERFGLRKSAEAVQHVGQDRGALADRTVIGWNGPSMDFVDLAEQRLGLVEPLLRAHDEREVEQCVGDVRIAGWKRGAIGVQRLAV